MKKEKKIKRLTWGLMLVFALCPAAAADQKKDSSTEALRIQPDLRVVSIKAERIGFTAAGAHRVQVKVTVVNAATAAVCAGLFWVRVEKRSPGGVYSFLGQQSVAKLCANPIRARVATVTLSFDDTVPAGQQRVWRATADITGAVAEAREDNNQAESEVYVAKTFCPGVDLLATKVEIVRGSSGVFIKVFGRNRCIGTCAGNVQAVFDVVAPDADWTGVCQRVGSAAEGLLEYESGMIGVYGSSEHAVTYRVGIEFERGTCTDTNPGNNFCDVILRPDENRKTFNCH